MDHDEFNAFCATLPATTYVVQWRGAHVWKVGGKVFAIGVSLETGPGFTFKVSELSYELLRQEPGLRPAPYFASRGMKWIQHYEEPGLPDDALKDYLRESHRIVTGNLTRKIKKELGLSD